jgi:hypothetical protein
MEAPGGERGNVQTGQGRDRVITISLLGCSTSVALAVGPEGGGGGAGGEVVPTICTARHSSHAVINVSCISQDIGVVVCFNPPPPPEWVVRVLFKLKDVSYYGLNNIRDTTAKTSCFQALLHLSYCWHEFTGHFCRLFIIFFFAVVNSQYSSSVACSVHGRSAMGFYDFQ